MCYRINYRSMDRCEYRPHPVREKQNDANGLLYCYRSLSNDEVNAIQEKVEARLVDTLAVEIR